MRLRIQRNEMEMPEISSLETDEAGVKLLFELRRRRRLLGTRRVRVMFGVTHPALIKYGCSTAPSVLDYLGYLLVSECAFFCGRKDSSRTAAMERSNLDRWYVLPACIGS